MANRTDEEVICTFMEPKPSTFSAFAFCILDLDALHEVEAKLTDSQWESYNDTMLGRAVEFYSAAGRFDHANVKGLLHATAEQKIRALAAVLRPLVKEKP